MSQVLLLVYMTLATCRSLTDIALIHLHTVVIELLWFNIILDTNALHCTHDAAVFLYSYKPWLENCFKKPRHTEKNFRSPNFTLLTFYILPNFFTQVTFNFTFNRNLLVLLQKWDTVYITSIIMCHGSSTFYLHLQFLPLKFFIKLISSSFLWELF